MKNILNIGLGLIIALIVLSFVIGIMSVIDNSHEKGYKVEMLKSQKNCDNFKNRVKSVLNVKNDSLFNVNYKYYMNDSLNLTDFNKVIKNKQLTDYQYNKVKDLKCEFHSNQNKLVHDYKMRKELLDNIGVLDTVDIKISTINKINSCR